MTAVSLPAPTALASEAPTVVIRSGALLHRVRAAAVAVWRLAPGRYLAIPDGDDVVVLPLGRLTRIGRRTGSDIVLDDTTVSRRHALVLEREGAPVIADDRSLNGVFVNGRRVQEAPLHHGDEVRIGDRLMRYRRDSRDESVERRPARAVPLAQPAVVGRIGRDRVLREQADARRALVARDRVGEHRALLDPLALRREGPAVAALDAVEPDAALGRVHERAAVGGAAPAPAAGEPCAHRAHAVAAELGVVVVVERPDPALAALEAAPVERVEQRGGEGALAR